MGLKLIHKYLVWSFQDNDTKPEVFVDIVPALDPPMAIQMVQKKRPYATVDPECVELGDYVQLLISALARDNRELQKEWLEYVPEAA